MFGDQNIYEAKVFLRAVGDAQTAFRQAAQEKSQVARYETQALALQQASTNQAVSVNNDAVTKGKNFLSLREVKLFQFSNNTFKKYLPGFDGYSGDYAGLKKLLNDAVTQLQQSS